MADFKCDVETFQRLLESIDTKLSEVKLSYVDFGIAGSSSGLNSFIYSYIRLANFLVEYRRFVRNDIVEVCDAVYGFIQLDKTVATKIYGQTSADIDKERDRIISSFQGFTDNVRKNNEVIGSQTLPSINVSSFKVSRLDIEIMASKYTSCLLSLSARLRELYRLIESFSKSPAFTGLTATAIKSYWIIVHIPVVKAIDTVLWTLNDYLVAYGTDLKTLVNDDSYFVFTQSEMEATITELSNIRASLAIIVDDVDSKITSYSSLLGINVTIPNGRPMLDKYEQEAIKIQSLISSINSYESSKVTLVKNYIDEFVTDATKLISEIDSKTNIKDYKADEVMRICNKHSITSIEDASACEKSYRKYIEAFEAANPEYADAMNKFLNKDTDLTTSLNQDMKERIKYWAYTAPEPYKTALMNSIIRGDFQLGYLSIGKFPVEKWFGLAAHDNVFTNTVNYTTDVIDKKDMGTVFHEMGHACDDSGGIWWGSTDQVLPYKTYNATMGKEVTFNEAMNYDIYDNPNNPHSIYNIAKNCGVPGNYKKVVAAFKNNALYPFLSEEDKKLYREICKRFMSDRNNYVNAYTRYATYPQERDALYYKADDIYGGVTDTYGGKTHNGLINNYDDKGKSTGRGACGHDDYYWNIPWAIAPTEFYAEYFSANVTGNEQELARMREYYPEACKVADSYTKNLAGK